MATLAVAAGCAGSDIRTTRPDPHHPPATGGQAVRERLLQADCRGKSLRSLVDAMGAPRASLEIPGRDPALTWVASYGTRDARAGCTDAFTIMLVDGEERIVDCFCR